MSLESLKVQIIKKAWEDPAFKASLLADPKGAIKEALGIELPAEVEIAAVEESAAKYYLVIPPNPADAGEGEDPLRYVWN